MLVKSYQDPGMHQVSSIPICRTCPLEPTYRCKWGEVAGTLPAQGVESQRHRQGEVDVGQGQNQSGQEWEMG